MAQLVTCLPHKDEDLNLIPEPRQRRQCYNLSTGRVSRTAIQSQRQKTQKSTKKIRGRVRSTGIGLSSPYVVAAWGGVRFNPGGSSVQRQPTLQSVFKNICTTLNYAQYWKRRTAGGIGPRKSSVQHVSNTELNHRDRQKG